MATYKLLATQTVGSGGAASVTFNNIDQTYTDLVIKLSTRNTTSSNTNTLVTFNGSNSGYSNKVLYGSGAAAASASQSLNEVGWEVNSGQTSSTFSNNELYIPNYTSSNYKSSSGDGVQENNGTTAYSSLDANLWSNTAAITSVTLTPSGGTYAQYSTFSIYGVSNTVASAAPAGTTTIGTATAVNPNGATVAFTYSGSDASYFQATSSPGGITAVSQISPISVTGLTPGTSYTFTVKPYNFQYGPGVASAASNSVTPSSSFVSLATAVVDSGGASSITFNSIPSTYNHLQLRVYAQETVSGGGFDNMNYYFQSDNASGNYVAHSISGDGSTIFAQGSLSRNTGLIYNALSTNSNVFGATIIDIMDYASTHKNKTIRALAGVDFNGSGRTGITSGLWLNNTTAISSITLTASSFTQNTKIALYGVL
jgi:hypothetical protein